MTRSAPRFCCIIYEKTLKCDQKTCWKKWENPQLNIIDNILLSKVWGIKAVFYSVNFRPWRFFCWTFERNCGNNIEATLGKIHSCESVILTFLKSHFLLVGVFLRISCLFLGGLFLLCICCDDDIYLLYCYWFISIS